MRTAHRVRMRPAHRTKAGPALAAATPCEYDPAIMRTSWEDGRWGS